MWLRGGLERLSEGEVGLGGSVLEVYILAKDLTMVKAAASQFCNNCFSIRLSTANAVRPTAKDSYTIPAHALPNSHQIPQSAVYLPMVSEEAEDLPDSPRALVALYRREALEDF